MGLYGRSTYCTIVCLVCVPFFWSIVRPMYYQLFLTPFGVLSDGVFDLLKPSPFRILPHMLPVATALYEAEGAVIS